jgi:hypothetical protein
MDSTTTFHGAAKDWYTQAGLYDTTGTRISETKHRREAYSTAIRIKTERKN